MTAMLPIGCCSYWIVAASSVMYTLKSQSTLLTLIAVVTINTSTIQSLGSPAVSDSEFHLPFSLALVYWIVFLFLAE